MMTDAEAALRQLWGKEADAVLATLRHPEFDDATRRALRELLPPPDLTMSQWADEYRVLSKEASAEPGPWNTSRFPPMRDVMDAISDPLNETVVLMFSAQASKALALDTPIPTPQGWTTMGALQEGDLVLGSDGKPTVVLGATGVMLDHECYRVLFSDGTSIDADAGHQWEVVDSGKYGHKAETRVLETKQMVESVSHGARNRYAVSVAAPLQLPEVSLPLDPYWLGVWLGDGHSASSTISVGSQDLDFMTAELANIDPAFGVRRDKSCYSIAYRKEYSLSCSRGHLKSEFPRGNGSGCPECHRQRSKTNMYPHLGDRYDPILNPSMHNRLEALGVLKNKHVPEAYLRASYPQRLSLLQGLMDTDGSISARGRCSFVSTSFRLAEGVLELLRSLGLKPTVRDLQPSTVYRGRKVLGKPAKCIQFTAYRDDARVFRLPRKAVRLPSVEGRRVTETKRRKITGITPIKSIPVKCIYVEAADHLYLAGEGMIPTHNTEILCNSVGYFADQDPSPMLMVQYSLEMAETWSKDRLAPMVRDSPALTKRFGSVKSRDGNNTILHKGFTGGQIAIAGANSAGSLASRPVRIVLFDEVDRYPASAGTEGDPVALGEERTETYYNRKIIMASTPGNEDTSRIEPAYKETTQFKCLVPCPECGHKQELRFANFKWEDDDPRTVKYVCEGCAYEIPPSKREWMVANYEWVATGEAKKRGAVGFHIWRAYSPWSSWEQIVEKFLLAKGNPERLKVFVNTVLAETFKAEGLKLDGIDLYNKREKYELIPKAAKVLIAAIDHQDDRLEALVTAFGAQEEWWAVDHIISYGNPAQEEVWDAMAKQLQGLYEREDGYQMKVRLTGVDTGGHHTTVAYKFCKKYQSQGMVALRGHSTPGQPIISRPTKLHKHQGLLLYTVGTDTAKDLIFSRLQLEFGQQPAIHFPWSFDPEFFAQVTSEKRVTAYRAGIPYSKYIKTRPRNEALDLLVYNRAVLNLLALDLDSCGVDVSEEGIGTDKATPSPVVRPGGGFINRPGGSFINPRR